MKKIKLGKVVNNLRGFEVVEFKDYYGYDCSLQQSSLADYEPPGSSAIWLGLEGDSPKIHSVTKEPLGMRMHLSLKQVKQLITVLNLWVANGSFKEAHEKEKK